MKNRSSNLVNRYSLQLIFIAASTLYLELAVIRFSAAEILHLGYFSNFILISVFVGLSLGFLSVDHKINLKKYFPFALVILFAFILFSRMDVESLRDQETLFFFGEKSLKNAQIPLFILLPILFTVTAFLFAALGQQTGCMFKYFTPLKAYTLDIAGSLLGIGLFSFQSFIWSSPSIWIFTSSTLMILFYLLGLENDRLKHAIFVAFGGICICFLLISFKSPYKTIWSFYQKIQFANDNLISFTYTKSHSRIYVNGILHQFLSTATQANKTYYGTPYKFLDNGNQSFEDVLIIGAGSGTDVSVALLNGAKNIDAVEIDAGIISLGKEYHPDKPYNDERVNLFVRDGREFLMNGSKKYDLIIFALPDSLLRFSPMSSVRLESYLYTLEAFKNVKKRLNPNGTFVLYNMYRWAWLKDRVSSMILVVFGKKPVRIENGLYTIFAIKNQPWENFRKNISLLNSGLPTDNWPFFYLKYPHIPLLYIGVLGMFIVAAFLGIWFFSPKGTLTKPQLPFFFMGAAFLLLETKSISLFALLFGATWMVNSLAFAGILFSILIANWVVHFTKINNRGILFILLFGALSFAYFFPPVKFLNISNLSLRYMVVIIFVFSPIFFANLLFSREFRDVEQSSKALGWNVFGAVIGGGLEYCSLLVGHKNLLLIVAFLYLLIALILKNITQTQKTQIL